MATTAPSERGTRLTSKAAESQAFWRMRIAMLRSLAHEAFHESRIQAISILLASTVLWCGLFFLFFEGFLFIERGLVHTGIRTQLIHAVFNVFFLALTVMLFFSSAIITYGSIYRGDEVPFLLSQPIRGERIAVFKFQEAVFFSCWGFILLGSPMLIAYGMVANSPWYYYVLLIPFILSFVFVPSGLGAICCLLVVRVLPRVRFHALAVLTLATLGIAAWVGWRVLAYEDRDMMTMNWFQNVLSRLEFSEQRLLPNWWLSSGLLEAAHPVEASGSMPSWLESLLFLTVLMSNAFLLQIVFARIAAVVLRRSFSGLAEISKPKRRAGDNWVDRAILGCLSPLPRTLRHFILKDVRLFRRDPVQWSQCAIFFGLLALYFFNVRRFDYAESMARWVLIMSFMNLAVVGLILSTFTTRFIFPMISLEGRSFWILGTAPINRDSVLWGKFWFACAGALPVCSGLVLVSDLMLGITEMSPTIVVIHQITCWVLCIGLSALAVGLGARLPNLREPSPSKIAAGFGGTLNLVLSSLFIMVVMLSTAIPCVLWTRLEWDSRVISNAWWFGGTLGLGSSGSVAIGVLVALAFGSAATFLPLRSGLRAFRRLEF